LLTNCRTIIHELAAYGHDWSLLPTEAISQLTQADGLAAELLTCLHEDAPWDIESLFGLFRWMWRERSFRNQQQNSRASVELAEEYLQGNEQCRAILEQVIQRVSEFRPQDPQIQPVLTQIPLEELVLHLPEDICTSQYPSLDQMLEQFRQRSPLQWSGETAEDLKADENYEYSRALASTIVQELRFADGLVVRPIAVHESGTKFNLKQLVDILNFARESRLYQLKLQASRNLMELVMPSEPEEIDPEIEKYCDDLPEPSVSDLLVLGPGCYRLASIAEIDRKACDELKPYVSVDTKYTDAIVEGLISAHWGTISEQIIAATDARARDRLQDVLEECESLLSQYDTVSGNSLTGNICSEPEPQDDVSYIPYSPLSPQAREEVERERELSRAQERATRNWDERQHSETQ
jgi:hypothetical protein